MQRGRFLHYTAAAALGVSLPDATFFLDIQNKLAEEFLRENKLEEGGVICAVPRL